MEIYNIRKIIGLFADENRFKIIAAVALGAGTLEKIATVTGLSNPAIMKAIVKLEGAGLIEKKETGYICNVDVLKAVNREYSRVMPKKLPLTGIDRFIKDGKIITYPSRPDDQLMILEYIIKIFEFNRKYPEKEVNEKLKNIFADYASMRRYLYDKRFFDREQKTGESGQTVTFYRRVK